VLTLDERRPTIQHGTKRTAGKSLASPEKKKIKRKPEKRVYTII